MSILAPGELEDLRAEWTADLSPDGVLWRQPVVNGKSTGAYAQVKEDVLCAVSLGGGNADPLTASFMGGAAQVKQSAPRKISFAWDEDVRTGDNIVINGITYHIGNIEIDMDQPVGQVADAELPRLKR